MADKTSEKKKDSKLMEIIKRMVVEQTVATYGALITFLMICVAIFGKYLAPYGLNEMTTHVMSPPSVHFWMGTDNLGRDILSRVIYGARVSVVVGLAAATISVAISTVIGVVSGYIGGVLDLIVQRFVDAFGCLPGLVILMLLLSLTGTGLWQIVIILGVTSGIGGSRIIRGVVFTMKENTYLQAAVSTGDTTLTIFTKHILPNIFAPIIIIFSMGIPALILSEAGLAFLGFGIPPPTPTWGGMLTGNARTYMFHAPWMALFPGLALSILVFAVNMLGDGLRDVLDPRLRGGAGRYGIKIKKVPTIKKDKQLSQSENPRG